MERFNLQGKLALVSGSTGGIGKEISVVLAQAGAEVIINGRTQERVDQALKSIAEKAPTAKLHGVAADLATVEGVQQVADLFPEVDILINNLGIFSAKNFEDLTDEEWMNIFEVNVMSGVRLCRVYLPKMKTRGWGRIIFISSESAINIPVEMIHYGMTKTAQIAIARGLAEGTTGTNVTVNSVLVGPTYSEGVQRFVNGLAEQKQISVEEVEKEFFVSTRPTSIIKRFLTEEEVANLVFYLATPASSGTNGAALRIDGGLLKNCI